MDRPTSVTIIAWLLIAMAVLNLLSMATGYWIPVARNLFAHSGNSETAHSVSGIVGMLATIVFAAFMLRGANWARWLYLVWVSAGVVALTFFASSWLYVLPGAIKTLVIGYFLTRRDAGLFFTRKSMHAPSPEARRQE